MVMQLYSFSFTSKLSYMLIICDYCMSHFLLASQIQTLSASLLIQKITFLFLTILKRQAINTSLCTIIFGPLLLY